MVVFLVGLLAALVNFPALAAVDCEARPNHPQCGGTPEPPQISSVVVTDSTGKVVGPFLISALQAPIGTRVLDSVVWVIVRVDVSGTLRTFAASVTDSGFQGFPGILDFAFSTDDICGTPLYKPAEISLGLEFAFIEGGIAYISANPNDAPVGISSESRLSFDGTCTAPGFGNVTGVLPTVTVDLNALFTPPFKLEMLP